MDATAGRTLRVLVADDHEVVCQGLVAFLDQQAGMEVSGTAADGQAALESIRRHRPHVAVLDVAMPGLTGIEVARKVADERLKTATVLLSMHREAEVVRGALDAGARGYVLKEAKGAVLVEAIRTVAAGERYVCPRVTGGLLEALREGSSAAAVRLTPRERDVLRHLAEGLSSKEIAAALSIKKRTVDWYRGQIMDKVGIRTVPGLVKYALQHRICTSSP